MQIRLDDSTGDRSAGEAHEAPSPLRAVPLRAKSRGGPATLADLPKGRFEADDEAIEKAEAMLRRGKPAAFVSDYLGMDAGQVAEIGDRLVRDQPPTRPAARPKRDRTADERAARRSDAVRGSQALAAAISQLLARSG